MSSGDCGFLYTDPSMELFISMKQHQMMNQDGILILDHVRLLRFYKAAMW
jgi:hypothetical protein